MLAKPSSRPFLNSTTVFTLTLLVLGLTVLGVYLFGLGRHHTFFQNSLLSTTLLSVAFFVFVSAGLYRGVKMKDTIGKITDRVPVFTRKEKDGTTSKFSFLDFADISSFFSKSKTAGDATGSSFDLGDADDEGFIAILVGIVLWVLVAIGLAIILWLFGEVLLVALFAFMGMLYWIFYRALRLVFRHSHKTKGRLFPSLGYGLVYTLLYNSWIYGIFFLLAYLKG